MDPVLLLLFFSSASALAATLGMIPLGGAGETPLRWIGWANALAAGLMLGNGMVLAEAGLSYSALEGAAGALVGIGFVYWTHQVSGTAELELSQLGSTPPEYGYKVLLVGALHAASEGVAMGVAMLHSVPLGVWIALTMGLHNIPEGTVLGAVLRSNNVSRGHTALLLVVTNVGQVFLAITVYAVVSAAPVLFPLAVGFAVGALIFLALAEQLPESYEQAGATGIALVSSIAMGIVVLLGGGAL
jgi:zinc transporter, ZIP family